MRQVIRWWEQTVRSTTKGFPSFRTVAEQQQKPQVRLRRSLGKTLPQLMQHRLPALFKLCKHTGNRLIRIPKALSCPRVPDVEWRLFPVSRFANHPAAAADDILPVVTERDYGGRHAWAHVKNTHSFPSGRSLDHNFVFAPERDEEPSPERESSWCQSGRTPADSLLSAE